MLPRIDLRRLLLAGLLLLAVTSIAAWLVTRKPLPPVLRIATGAPGGQYHVFASELVEELEAVTGSRVEVVATPGSRENARLLFGGDVDLAIVQAAGVNLEGLAVLAPLYPEVVSLVVRRGRGLETLSDLPGRSFALGEEGSGMRGTAERILDHYRMGLGEIVDHAHYFHDLLSDPELDGALITTGIDNPDLAEVLASGEFQILPLLDADAIALREPLFEVFDVPRGLFHERPPVPEVRTRTVATTALLVAPEHIGERLAQAVLRALYRDEAAGSYPNRIRSDEILDRSPVPLHPAVRQYLDPFGPLSDWQLLIDGLAGLKELLVGGVALLILLWERLRAVRQQRQSSELVAQKEHLDTYVEKTMEIERALAGEEDPTALEQALVRISSLKLEALDKLTHEDLRGDRMFLIFLQQCADLSSRLEARLARERASSASGDGRGSTATGSG